MKASVRCAIGPMLLVGLISGCTMTVKRKDGERTYTWPVPGSVAVLPQKIATKKPDPAPKIGAARPDELSSRRQRSTSNVPDTPRYYTAIGRNDKPPTKYDVRENV